MRHNGDKLSPDQTQQIGNCTQISDARRSSPFYIQSRTFHCIAANPTLRINSGSDVIPLRCPLHPNKQTLIREEWIAAIKQEEALASVNHTVAEVDKWEGAHFTEDKILSKVKTAKKKYEDALREKFFGF